MPTNPKTGTKSKFVMSTMFLFWKLTEIQNHLRDCSQDIVDFSKMLASNLDFFGQPDMRPWDFVREWKKLIDFIRFEISNPLSPHEIWEPIKLAHWKPEQLQNFDQKMFLVFAEDLCGKEFAEVAVLYAGSAEQTSGFPKNLVLVRYKTIENFPIDPLKDRLNFTEFVERHWHRFPIDHQFPPEKPVMMQDAERLGEFERVLPPPGYEFGNHIEAEPLPDWD